MNKRKRELIKLTKEEAEEIIYDDNEEYCNIKEIHHDSGRWTASMEKIVKRKKDNKLFSIGYQQGLTEMQDGIEIFDPELIEVEEIPVTVISYDWDESK